MLCTWKRTLVALFLVLLLWPSSAWAQTDPEGRELAEAMGAALVNEDNDTFVSLFSSEPTLTKRAFVSVLEYVFENTESDPEGSKDSLLYAAILAQSIETSFGDPVPSQIMTLLLEQKPAFAIKYANYASELYRPYASSPYVLALTGATESSPTISSPDLDPTLYGSNSTRASDFSNERRAVGGPVQTKILRLALAIAFSDPRLLLQELDTFEPVIEDFRSALTTKTGSLEPASQALIDDNFRLGEMIKLDLLVDLGVQDFDSRLESLLASEGDVNNRLSVYMTAFEVAYRQQDYTKSQLFLEKLSGILAEEVNGVSPVFRFAVKTAEFQQQSAGTSATPSQILTAFERAWAELGSYRPMYRMSDDTAWAEGRIATRYWIEHLSALGPSGEPGLRRVAKDSLTWLRKAHAYDGLADLGSEDYIYYVMEIQGWMTLYLSSIDIRLHVFETLPKLMLEEAGDASTVAELMVEVLTPLQNLPETLQINISGPNFPSYSFREVAYTHELAARTLFLAGLDPTAETTERVRLLEGALPEFSKFQIPGLYIDYHLKIGREFQKLGRQDLALLSWQRALVKAEETGFVAQAIQAASLLAEEYGKAEDWTKAGLYADKASEGAKTELASADAESGGDLAKTNSDLSKLAVKAHIKSDNPEKALAAIASSHQMNTATAQLKGNKKAAEATKLLQTKKKQVATLTQKVQELKELPISETRDEMLNKAQSLLAQSKSDFLLQSRNIRQKFAKLYTTALRFDPLNLPDIQKALPADAAVVQYFATGEELYIFVVTPSKFRLHSVAVTKGELDSTILAFLRKMQRPKAVAPELEKLSSKLYGYLVAPIEADLNSSTTLILIPAGKLNVLPFGALQDEQGQPLLAKKTVVELAKATDFMTLLGEKPEKISSVVAFANATLDLPAAEAEGEAIKRVFPLSQLFTGGEASKSNLMKFGSKAEVLHLATHGTWDPNYALNNHLKLSNGEKLAQEEIFNLDLGETSIVTLSACSTALADTKDVEFVASLAEAFWIAGSNSVVASLWQVDDNSTGLLMTKFYENLKAGDGRGDALRKAQLEVRENPKFAHPYFWSGFLLFGDYR